MLLGPISIKPRKFISTFGISTKLYRREVFTIGRPEWIKIE